MKLACVVHRFGDDIAGGSERHCLAIAERLAVNHDVTVLTTCARDHVTWKNEYPSGTSRLGRLRVRRFPVARPRSLHRFAEISELVFGGAGSESDQKRWFVENGPETPALLEHLDRHGSEYDRILFWSFRYYQTFFGLPLVRDRAVLVPTAEDDPAIRLDILEQFFRQPWGLVFLTPEEQTLVERRSGQSAAHSCIIGIGLEPPEPLSANSEEALRALAVSKPFVLYLGRLDRNKGCETLLRYYLAWCATATQVAPLVLAGPGRIPVADHPLVRRLGYVNRAVRELLLSSASVLVVPSPFESLSLALLEGWNHGVPALVNGRCGVLKGQALRANGALYYHDMDEFACGLEYLLTHPGEARQVGCQGRAYVDRDYRWPQVMARLEAFLAIE